MLTSNFTILGRKIKHFLFLSFLFFLVSCGLPGLDDDSLKDLKVPMGLTVSSNCSGATLNGVDISFWGYNPEQFFSGYNVYVFQTNQPNDTAFNTIIGNHRVKNTTTNTYTWVTSVENDNIVRNDKGGSQPTITREDLSASFPNYFIMPTLITKTLKLAPYNMHSGGGFQNAFEYYFLVTSVSVSSVKESHGSNIASDQNPAHLNRIACY